MTALLLFFTLAGMFFTIHAITWTARQRRYRQMLEAGRNEQATSDEINECLNQQA